MNSLRIFFLVVTQLFITLLAFSQDDRRWQMNSDGSIEWFIGNRIPHDDHIELSGKQISCVLRYGVASDSSFHASRSLVWPMLRTIPNNTHASLTRRFAQDAFEMVTVNYRPITAEKVTSISLNGILTVNSRVSNTLELTRQYFPSTDLPVYCEVYRIKNISGKKCVVEIPKSTSIYQTDPKMGTEGAFALQVNWYHGGSYQLQPNESVHFSLIYSGAKLKEPTLQIEAEYEMAKRLSFVQQVRNNLVLETPDTVLNRAFAFAKIRAAESIFETKGGPMHGPGGESYYAAIWANDQAEYIGPFFPYLGYDIGNKASLNAYKHFARFMNPEYKPIPSSIIAEGLDIWNGAGDRGDAAMIAYGAARFALASGDKNIAKELWKLIEWCLEYCNRKIDKNGVVASDSDELEGRFPSGNANLCTSSLYYDALISSTYLVKELNLPKKDYLKQAELLRKNIEKHFGYTLKGFETYRYYEGNDKLRAWICIPLTVGIFDRKQGTIDALFSPQLWTNDGLATEEGDKTFWDRSTLYALRGVFTAGETEKAIDYLKYYSNRRLLGDHVPYPVEAYPEGNQRHLSAESGLYCRIITEGIFGIRPTGLKTFTLTPRLPKDWNNMKLKHVRLFGEDFDISVTRKNEKLEVQITKGKKLFSKTIKSGSTSEIEL